MLANGTESAQALRSTAPRRPLPPFTDAEGSRSYREIYRAVCEYHERNHPPRLTPEYWEKAAADMRETALRFKNDPFTLAMLDAVYEELEREYKALETQQRRNAAFRPAETR